MKKTKKELKAGFAPNCGYLLGRPVEDKEPAPKKNKKQPCNCFMKFGPTWTDEFGSGFILGLTMK